MDSSVPAMAPRARDMPLEKEEEREHPKPIPEDGGQAQRQFVLSKESAAGEHGEMGTMEG